MAHDILPINYYILTLLWCVYAVRLFLTFIRFGYLRWTSSSEILYSLRHRLHPHPHPFSLCCCEAPMEWSHNCFRYNGNHIINRLKNDFYAIGPAFLSLQEQTKIDMADSIMANVIVVWTERDLRNERTDTLQRLCDNGFERNLFISSQSAFDVSVDSNDISQKLHDFSFCLIVLRAVIVFYVRHETWGMLAHRIWHLPRN